MAEPTDSATSSTVVPIFGVGDRVRINITSEGYSRRLRPSTYNGLEGQIVAVGWGGYDEDRIIRMDDQSGDVGWTGGDPGDPDAYCVHLPVESLEMISLELRVGSRVRFDTNNRTTIRGTNIRGIPMRIINGETGTVVSTDHAASGYPDDVVVRPDNQSLGYGWIGGDPRDPRAYCVHFPRQYLTVITDPEPETEPETEPEPHVTEWKKNLYAKAMDLARGRYSDYTRQVERWLHEVGVAPQAVTYRISGELKYESSRFPDTVPSTATLGRERLEDLPEVKLEVAEVTFPRQRPGETIESLTAEIFALVDRVVASGEVCNEAKAFVRRLGLRPPPRKTVTVQVEMNLNAYEQARLERTGSGTEALVDLICEQGRGSRDRLITSVRVVPDETVTEPEDSVTKPGKPKARKSRSRNSTELAPTAEPAPELAVAT